MAGRQLKRLQQQAAQPSSDEAAEEGIRTDSPPAAAKPSLFDLLVEEGAHDDLSEQSKDTDGSGEEADASPLEQRRPAPAKTGPKLRKRRKAKKSAAKARSLADSSEGGEEDLDKLLERLNIPLSTAEPPREKLTTSAATSALAVHVHKLKPENELRRIFGSKVVNEQARESNGGAEFAGASRRVRRLLARGVLRKEELRPGLLITPRDHWPRPDNGLGIERQQDAEGGLQFVYTYSPGYQAAQAEFERVQASYDPNQLLGFLSYHPYHIDALLAASDLYRVSGQDETADDLLARCVYGLEMAWAPPFNPTTGHCRLSPEREENIGCLRALSRYVQSLTRRGLHASALENAKLLLSLERADGCASVLCIDYLAIKARQYDFPQALVAELDPAGQDFSGFPNWTYSLALAAFLREMGGGAETATEETLSRGARAVMLMPGVVLALSTRLKEQGTRLNAEFQKALEHALFRQAEEEPSASLAHLTAIYVERQYTLYKDPVILGWLQQCCKVATAPENDGQRASWAAAKEQLWPPSHENEFSALRISQFSDNVAALPQEELQVMAAQRDWPPEEELARLLEQADGQLQAPGQEPADLAPDEGVALALLRTLLPWVNVGRDPGADGSREGEGDANSQPGHDEGHAPRD